MKKKLLIASAVAASTLGLTGTALAHSGGMSAKDDLSAKLAEKFNLNADEVNTFLEEQRDARMADIEAKVSESLKAAGFSDEQISAMQNKKKEQREAHRAWHEANPNATAEERKAHREEQKEVFENWAKEQGIDLEKVRETLKDSGLGRKMRHEPRHED